MDLPPSLVQQVKEGRVALFLGAGASRGAQLPDGTDPPLAEALRDRIGKRFLGRETVPKQREAFAHVLTCWASASVIHVRVEWQPTTPSVITTPRLMLGSDNLFSTIVVQLIQVCSAARGLVQCSACPTWYAPVDKHGRPRWPQTGRRHFCPPCRAAGVPVKLAQETYRRKPPRGRIHVKAPRKSRRQHHSTH